MEAKSEKTHRPELIFALVGGAGVRLNDLCRHLKEQLDVFGYKAREIRLSDLLVNYCNWKPQLGHGEYYRVRNLQEMGNAFRDKLKDGAALPRAAVAEIRAIRAEITGDANRPADAQAYIIHQLKHPDEVDLLRQVYGSSFLLIAGHAPKPTRAAKLAERMAETALSSDKESFVEKAYELIRIDDKENDNFGQNTRDTYPKADFFANLGRDSALLEESDVRRFVELVFGHPFRTPSQEEYSMYQASAASLRSSDDSRQVGAAIVTLSPDGTEDKAVEVIAVGMNEVPRPGGGSYWDGGSPDHRDQALLERGKDLARNLKIAVLAELIEKIRLKNWLHASLADKGGSDLATMLLDDIRRTQFMEIGEFSRPVHAEMAALIDSARRGVSVNGHAMYVTTFPCHNCAKHIIAAGLRKVVYLEPYAKSRAKDLYEDDIFLDSRDGMVQDRTVVFCPFTGVGPRQYGMLFSMSERGSKKGRPLNVWKAEKRSLTPMYVAPNDSAAYLAAERQELEKLPTEIYNRDKTVVSPSQDAAPKG